MSKKITMVAIVIMIVFLIIPVQHSIAIDVGAYGNIYDNPAGSGTLFQKGGEVLSVIQAVGTGIAVIMLVVIGTKYMIASVEEKAKLKETLVPYLIGAILLFAGSNILTIVVKFVREININ